MTKKVGFKICLMVLIVLLCLTAFIGCDNSSNDDYGDIIVDYEDAELFEKALNNGEDTIGKIVKFRIDHIAPDYYLGTNYWAGEHLNMVPRESLIYDVGNMATVRVIAVMKDNDSWIIDCTNVLKEHYKIPLEEDLIILNKEMMNLKKMKVIIMINHSIR